jgi:fucose permease
MAQSPQSAASTTPAPPVAYARLMLASVLGMVMFGAVQVAPAVCLDTLGRELHLNFEQRGTLLALRMAALTVCLLVVGHFGDRRGRHHIVFWGLLVIALSQVLVARSHSYHHLLIAMLVSGLGYGVFEALINPLVAQLNPQHSARALNILNGLFSVGLVAGALSTGELLQAGYSWRLPFLLWTVPPVICAVLYMTPRYPAPPHAAEDPASAPPVRHFLSLPLFWVLVVAMILGGGTEAGLTSWAPNLAAQALGASAREGAWTTVLYGTFMAIGRFLSGLLVTRMRPVNLMLLSAALCGAATCALAFVPMLWGAYVLFALGGLFVACFWPTLLAVASDHISRGSTSLFSLLGAAGVTGCVLVPWVIGALGDVVGLRGAILVLPVCMALLVVLLPVAARLMARRRPEDAGGPEVE